MQPKLKPLADQVLLITGASSGIGLVTARMAADAGARVMLVARNGTALADAVRQIEAVGGVADFAVADVAIAEELRAAAAKAIARFGRIDTWVNNAGVTIYAKLADTPLDEHRRMFETNYFGVVNGATIAVEHLRADGGALITVASIAADLPSPILGAYAASKHAVKGYINALRMELTAEAAPIVVTLIKPAGIDTPIGRHAANHLDGEAMVPPPVYDPALVATAILDAAVHPRRAVTVGGVGRLQVLVGTHFPALLDRLAGLLIPAMRDPDLPRTPGSSLFAPGADGEERSGLTRGLQTSLYTATIRHKGMMLGGLAVAGMIGTIASRSGLSRAAARGGSPARARRASGR